jgi:hypothetical protein
MHDYDPFDHGQASRTETNMVAHSRSAAGPARLSDLPAQVMP